MERHLLINHESQLMSKRTLYKMQHQVYTKFIYFIVALLSCFLFTCPVFAEPNKEGIQVYHKNIHISPERETLAEDINHFHHAEDLWDDLRQSFSLPHYEDNPLVQEQIEWLMNHQDFLSRSASRAAPYLYYIYQQAKKRNLPGEVVLLPIFESSFNPFAYSSAGAAGIWQMMPNTASGYGIRQDWWYDGRRDVIASTKAALNHLAYLSNFFDNNWLLSIAAYDTGQGNVLSAINRNIRDGVSTDYWSLPVAQETRIYVPRLLALATIIAHPEKYPVYLPPVRNAPYLAQMEVGSQINLKQAANLAGMSLKKLMELNPGYNRAITAPNGPTKLVLPIESVEEFSANLAVTPLYEHAGWEHYKVKSGENINMLAQRFNTSPAVIRKLNQLSSNHVKPGANLIIPHTNRALSETILAAETEQPVYHSNSFHPNLRARTKSLFNRARSAFASKAITEQIEANHGQYIIQPGDTIYMARDGDTFTRVAKHFRISTQALLAANPVDKSGSLQPGAKLVIPTHLINTQLASLDSKPRFDVSPGDTIYTVRNGDTMEIIASKFHTTPPAIRVSNLLASDDLHEGDRILIPTRA